MNIIWPHRPVPTICAWCGQNVTKDKASVHHLVPRADGGTDDVRNLTIVHVHDCHDRLEEWTQQEGRAPSGDEWGQLDSMWGNILVEGVGTAPQQHQVFQPDPPYGVENIYQIRRYLDFLKNINKQVGASA